MGVGLGPGAEGAVGLHFRVHRLGLAGQFGEGRGEEAGGECGHGGVFQHHVIRRHGGEFVLDHLDEVFGLHVADQDLDARLVHVIAPAERVVDAQDAFDIAQQVAHRQPFADFDRDAGGAAEAAAGIDFESGVTVFVALGENADVMRAHGGAVVRAAGDGDFELARQIGEFRVVGGPLAEDFRVEARVHDLIGGGTGEMVGGDVADAIAAGLDGVHVRLRQSGEDGGRVFQTRPVELDVLARGEMAVATVVMAGDIGELAHLGRAEHAVGDRDAQHVAVQLEVEPVHQPQRLELILGELAGEAAGGLVAELGRAVAQELAVVFVVLVDPGERRGGAFGGERREGWAWVRRVSSSRGQGRCGRWGRWRGSARDAG